MKKTRIVFGSQNFEDLLKNGILKYMDKQLNSNNTENNNNLLY